MQLVAYGAQDIYLTGNPQITFFKVVYRRHTNYSMESIEQTFNGTPDFNKRVTCTISRNGDLIHRVYLQTSLPEVKLSGNTANWTKFQWVNWIGHQLIKSAEVEIGGQRIDKHYGEWLHLWNELTQQPGLKDGYARMVGNVPALVSERAANADPEGTTSQAPLCTSPAIWFCRNPGLALPLIALQYHEVKLHIEFNRLDMCAKASTSSGNYVFTGKELSLGSTALWVDYIYLDTDERRRFAQVSHEYLIEQLQFTGEETVSSSTNKIKLNFNHPVKELVWVVQPNKNVDCTVKQYTNFSDHTDDSFATGLTMDALGNGLSEPTSDLGLSSLNIAADGELETIALGADSTAANNKFDSGVNPVSVCKLQLNGHDRFSEREGDYFNYVQPYQHHTNVPSVGINVYSFGLKPEEHQPSGTCNFSRIDNATLQMTMTANALNTGTGKEGSLPTGAKVRVYATNYNVLRIMSGMGGLAYSTKSYKRTFF